MDADIRKILRQRVAEEKAKATTQPSSARLGRSIKPSPVENTDGSLPPVVQLTNMDKTVLLSHGRGETVLDFMQKHGCSRRSAVLWRRECVTRMQAQNIEHAYAIAYVRKQIPLRTKGKKLKRPETFPVSGVLVKEEA